MSYIKTAEDQFWQHEILLSFPMTKEMESALIECRIAEREYKRAEDAKMSWRNELDPEVDKDKYIAHDIYWHDKLSKAERRAKTKLYAARRKLGEIAVFWAIQTGVIPNDTGREIV